MPTKRPTRNPPYRYGVTFLRRDGMTKTLGMNNDELAEQLFVDLAESLDVLSVEWKDARGQVIRSTRDSTCAWCGAMIGGQDGRLMLDELPFCGVCTQQIAVQTKGRTA